MSLVPRREFFGPVDKSMLRLSLDGKYVAYLAPYNGVMYVFVQEKGRLDSARAVTQDKGRGIFTFEWPYANDIILYMQDKLGDENFGLYSVNVKTLEVTEITKPGTYTTGISNVSYLHPDKVLIVTNERDPRYFDNYLVDLKTKEKKMVFQNDQNFSYTLTDLHLKTRLAIKNLPDASDDVYLLNSDSGKFEFFKKISFEDNMATYFLQFDASGDNLYSLESAGRNTAALIKYNIPSKTSEVLASSDLADVNSLLMDSKSKMPLAAFLEYDKKEVVFLSAAFEASYRKLQAKLGCGFKIVSKSFDDGTWLLFTEDSGQAPRYYFYECKRDELSEPILIREKLEAYASELHCTESVVIKSRDGLNLVSYLTKAKDNSLRALVLTVHGGPWSRDDLRFDPEHQWLANRGYNALSVNFRGSTGFGKDFINKADMQWSKTMHDDLIDACEWALAQGLCDRDKIIIMGGSYGGYATLAALTTTPDYFAAGVDIVGPSNLFTLLESTPVYWESFKTTLYRRVGDPRTEEGRKILAENSPLTHVEKIKKPLLIIQGANDQRVKQAEADQIVNAMRAKKIPVDYVLFPDEGHGTRKPENTMAQYAIIESFLNKHFGSVLEPVGEEIKKSSAQFP